MNYKFSKDLQNNYSRLDRFVKEGEEVSKEELLDRCTGKIERDLLQNIKEIDFTIIGRSKNEGLYIR